MCAAQRGAPVMLTFPHAHACAQSFFFGGVGDAPSFTATDDDSPPYVSPAGASPGALPPLASPSHDAQRPARRTHGFSLGGAEITAAALMMTESAPTSAPAARPRRASLSERAPGAYREPSLVTKMRQRRSSSGGTASE
jgi:hypothetical protein